MTTKSDKVEIVLILLVILSAFAFVGGADYTEGLERERDDARNQVAMLRSQMGGLYARATACEKYAQQ